MANENQNNSQDQALPLSEVYRRLRERGLRPLDYKDMPYEALLKLVGGK